MNGNPIADLRERAVTVLRANDRGGYTVPAAGLYPFQWNWDSCLVALGWACFDEARAWREIETLFAAQWPDGMVPHIVFHRDDPGYFPGPGVWATGREPASSGITQPPVAASCVRWMLERARDRTAALAAARRLFPKLLAWHAWFHSVRDPEGRGFVVTVHPWETGMDNSPAWDAPLAAVTPPPDLLPYERRDLAHVEAAQRPTRAEYDRYMTLVQLFRELAYDPAEMVTRSPFLVVDPATNAILLRADRDLAALAETLGERAVLPGIRRWIRRAETALPRLLADPGSGLWQAFDLRAGRRIGVRTHAGFLAFLAGLGDDRMADGLESWAAASRFALSSVAPSDPTFDRRRYWRGPVWPVTNFLIGRGLEESGRSRLARRLRRDTAALVARGGFREYFDPLDGTGLGGSGFGWTAAVWLAWVDQPERDRGPDEASDPPK